MNLTLMQIVMKQGCEMVNRYLTQYRIDDGSVSVEATVINSIFPLDDLVFVFAEDDTGKQLEYRYGAGLPIQQGLFHRGDVWFAAESFYQSGCCIAVEPIPDEFFAEAPALHRSNSV